jgi:hypothetical protein
MISGNVETSSAKLQCNYTLFHKADISIRIHKVCILDYYLWYNNGVEVCASLIRNLVMIQ